MNPDVHVRKRITQRLLSLDYVLWLGGVEAFLNRIPEEPLFNLIVTSPPYNLGKEYETRVNLQEYLDWQERVINLLVPRLLPGGSICWQVGNFVHDNEIFPLDIELAPIFKKHGLSLRNRIVWQFGHGLHASKRFSGRYEVVLWYTKSSSLNSDYTFNLDAVRIPAKYPGKKAFKGPNKGKISGNPLGKNPEDVWAIPNVKSNHIEKTLHPAQFPVGLVERLVLALTNPEDLVLDPFSGAASAGVAAALHGRRFWGCEPVAEYVEIGVQRIRDALAGRARYRPHSKPIYDHTKSSLSKSPR
ncbi:site-specific DNA-methyltransferase [SAR202 cluster bacterium AD-804-J14_MRT_500m]|nr:site-specific DNA-methyltransferase [SAR202 cluster bacterium AD-804-J14_MRT_500m]